MDGQSALDLIDIKLPQLVVTDIGMPIMDGLELAKIFTSLILILK